MDNGAIEAKIGGGLNTSHSEISTGAYVFAGVAAGLVFGFLLSQPIFFWKSNTVGNVAEVLNVVVAIFVGMSVFRLSRRTNKLADASNRINAAIHKIEADRIKRENNLHDAECSILLMAIWQEMRPLSASARRLRSLLEDKFGKFREADACWKAIDGVLPRLSVRWYEEHKGRLHILGPELATNLALLYGTIAQLKVLAANCATTDKENRAAAFEAVLVGLGEISNRAKFVDQTGKEVFELAHPGDGSDPASSPG